MTYDYVDGTATLVDGVYEEKPAPAAATFVVALELQADLITFGDLNGDGRGDAAAILVNAPGGSGVFALMPDGRMIRVSFGTLVLAGTVVASTSTFAPGGFTPGTVGCCGSKGP